MIRRKIIAKQNGNITSLIMGQMFLMVLLIWCLFSFRLTMLNMVFNYIDDSLTSSLLGGALINTEEYGKSNQLLIHNNDTYTEATGNEDTRRWEPYEAEILLSEINYGSDIILDKYALEKKTILETENRADYTVNREGKTEKKVDVICDKYLRQSVSALIGNFSYNILNGKQNDSDIRVDNIVDNVGTDMLTGKKLVISHDELEKHSFLADYIVSDIEITRYDIYNIYRTPLAERHVYQSKYLLYDNVPVVNQNATNITWNPDGPTNQTEFENLNLPYKYELKDGVTRAKNRAITSADLDPTKPNESYDSELVDYARELDIFLKDLNAYKKGYLVCYTDTRTTFQGEYDASKVPFNYFFSDETKSEDKFNVTHTRNARKVKVGEKAPINGYSVYSYKSPNSMYGYTAESSYNYKQVAIIDNGGELTGPLDQLPKVVNGKMDGTGVQNTSLYVEVTFTVKTFPNSLFGGAINTDKQVTVARLIDIDLNTDI